MTYTLGKIEKICREATPGPWRFQYDSFCTWLLIGGGVGRVPRAPDAEFVTAARTALPELVQRVRELEGVAPESLARKFHDTYERLAPGHGYTTRIDTREFNLNHLMENL